MMTEALLTALVVVLAFGVAWVISLARDGSLKPGQMYALAAFCAVGLLFMLVSDWPTGWMSVFWAEHSVLAGTLSSVLLVGLGFLVWERSDQERQNALASGLSGAGFGAVVDNIIDIEVALSLISGSEPPTVPEWDDPGRPLRWLRDHREQLATAADPRLTPVELPPADSGWRVQLLDQAVRRTVGSMRDWAPLIEGSELGTTALLAMSEVRKDCMELASRLSSGQTDQVSLDLLTVLRQRARILAYFFESFSGADPLRRSVLGTIDPLPPIRGGIDWAADSGATRFFNKRWKRALDPTFKALSE